jgi:mono/diheme cytochrome c family protein
MSTAGRALLAAATFAVLGAALAAAYCASGDPAPDPPHLADPANASMVIQGKRVYLDHCASCHGRSLQGQPLWQLDDQFAGRRAPPHDETGHTWRHADEDLFQKTKFGRFAGEADKRVAAMPAFAAKLTDEQIVAALAFIKSHWPLRTRIAQALLNPGFAGLPPGVDTAEWRFPPNCSPMRRRTASSAAR